MNFALLFAIIVGSLIILLAIYIAVKGAGTQGTIGGTKIAKEFSIILNPLDIGTASGKASEARLNQEIRIYNKCSTNGNFGYQKFSVSQRTRVVSEWSQQGEEISINSKYVFSENPEQGKVFYFFPKPFEIPPSRVSGGLRVATLVMMYTKNYCFKDPPDFVKNEIGDLHLKNVKLENCTNKDIEVCFEENCDISVFGTCEEGSCDNKYDYGYVSKDGKRAYYVGNLMYGAIFSDSDVYQCNLKRLMMRLKQLVSLYNEESSFNARIGCGSSMSGNLVSLIQKAQSVDSSSENSIREFVEQARIVDEQNSEPGGCGIW